MQIRDKQGRVASAPYVVTAPKSWDELEDSYIPTIYYTGYYLEQPEDTYIHVYSRQPVVRSVHGQTVEIDGDSSKAERVYVKYAPVFVPNPNLLCYANTGVDIKTKEIFIEASNATWLKVIVEMSEAVEVRPLGYLKFILEAVG